jgi:hypothetical protein
VLVALNFRNLVSASQDGKLIVWDGFSTNKVILIKEHIIVVTVYVILVA